MGLCIKTTVELDDELLRRSKERALQEGTSLKALIEEGLRHLLRRRHGAGRSGRGQARTKLPLCSQGGGLHPGIDLNDSADLEDRMNR